MNEDHVIWNIIGVKDKRLLSGYSESDRLYDPHLVVNLICVKGLDAGYEKEFNSVVLMYNAPLDIWVTTSVSVKDISFGRLKHYSKEFLDFCKTGGLDKWSTVAYDSNGYAQVVRYNGKPK